MLHLLGIISNCWGSWDWSFVYLLVNPDKFHLAKRKALFFANVIPNCRAVFSNLFFHLLTGVISLFCEFLSTVSTGCLAVFLNAFYMSSRLHTHFSLYLMFCALSLTSSWSLKVWFIDGQICYQNLPGYWNSKPLQWLLFVVVRDSPLHGFKNLVLNNESSQSGFLCLSCFTWMIF